MKKNTGHEKLEKFKNCDLILLSGYFILVASALRFKSFRLYRLGWSDGRLSRLFRLQESYIIAIPLLNVLLSGCDGTEVVNYCG